MNARHRLAGTDFVAGVAIEHHSRGVVDDVVGFLAAGTEVDGEHAGLVGVDERDVAAARRFHLDRFARLRQMRGIAALRGDPLLRLGVGTAGAERIAERCLRRCFIESAGHDQNANGLRARDLLDIFRSTAFERVESLGDLVRISSGDAKRTIHVGDEGFDARARALRRRDEAFRQRFRILVLAHERAAAGFHVEDERRCAHGQLFGHDRCRDQRQ